MTFLLELYHLPSSPHITQSADFFTHMHPVPPFSLCLPIILYLLPAVSVSLRPADCALPM